MNNLEEGELSQITKSIKNKHASGRDWELFNGDCLKLFKHIPDASIHCIITDPPYFIDGMGDDWNNERLQKNKNRAKVVGSLPTAMKFDPAQGKRFQSFMSQVAEEAFRVLKPGGFLVSFSQARLYHRMAIAIEDAGFEMRDMLGWVYEGQAKAFTQDHFVLRDPRWTDAEKQAVIESLGGRKTPQLKPCIEPMTLAQKPREGTFVDNWLAHQTGLIDTTVSLDGKFPGNLMQVSKPGRQEKGVGNEHLTVKPVRLISHLVRLLTVEGQIVLDPFTGSGSHGVATLAEGRKFIGFELDAKYFGIAKERINTSGGASYDLAA